MKLQTKLNEMNSASLLQYSKEVHKERLSYKVEDYLTILELIETRRKNINVGSNLKDECENSRMIKQFRKRK